MIKQPNQWKWIEWQKQRAITIKSHRRSCFSTVVKSLSGVLRACREVTVHMGLCPSHSICWVSLKAAEKRLNTSLMSLLHVSDCCRCHRYVTWSPMWMGNSQWAGKSRLDDSPWAGQVSMRQLLYIKVCSMLKSSLPLTWGVGHSFFRACPVSREIPLQY